MLSSFIASLMLVSLSLQLSLNQSQLQAEPVWQKLKTPRGTELEIQVHSAGPDAPVLVMAPGQSCNARRPFFEAFAQATLNWNITLVRLEWSYCQTSAQPAADLETEVQDLQTALVYARDLSGAKLSKVYVAGKSLGSLVAWKVFQRDQQIPAIALLTPVCSYDRNEQGQPLAERQNLLSENYPKLSSEKRPVFFLLGNQDSLCYPPILYAGLNESLGQVSVNVLAGGHGLNLQTPDKKEDLPATELNLKTAAQVLFNWLRQLPDLPK